jgi:outer membrane protein assembly factor BamB
MSLTLLWLSRSAKAQPPATTDWPQFGRTPTFQSAARSSASGAERHAEWIWAGAGDRLVASPAVHNRTVYYGSDDGHMYALQQSTGELLWSFEQTCTPAKAVRCGENGIRSSPAVDADGNVVFGSYDQYVYKVSAAGELVWKWKSDGAIYGPVSIDTDGTVLVGSMGAHEQFNGSNCLYALHGAKQAAGGAAQEKWRACGATVGAMNSGPAIGTGAFASTVVMNNYDDHIRAFDTKTGALRWSRLVGGPSGSSATIAGDTAFIGSWDRFLYALDMASGSVRWRFNTSGEIESHPAAHDGAVFVSTEEAHALYKLNATTGAVLWTYDGATAAINSSPSIDVANGIVYVGANDGALHAIDLATGARLFAVPTACSEYGHNFVFASAAISDAGNVYFSCNTGTARRRRRLREQKLADTPGQGIAYSIDPAKHLPPSRSSRSGRGEAAAAAR